MYIYIYISIYELYKDSLETSHVPFTVPHGYMFWTFTVNIHSEYWHWSGVCPPPRQLVPWLDLCDHLRSLTASSLSLAFCVRLTVVASRMFLSLSPYSTAVFLTSPQEWLEHFNNFISIHLKCFKHIYCRVFLVCSICDPIHLFTTVSVLLILMNGKMPSLWTSASVPDLWLPETFPLAFQASFRPGGWSVCVRWDCCSGSRLTEPFMGLDRWLSG